MEPTLTPFTSLHEVFAFYSLPSVTYKPVVLSWDQDTTVESSIKAAFDDQVVSFVNLVITVTKLHFCGLFLHQFIVLVVILTFSCGYLPAFRGFP